MSWNQQVLAVNGGKILKELGREQSSWWEEEWEWVDIQRNNAQDV